ncbi:glycerate kinase [Paractinoplanes ferrugineus]|uniref:Glycerate kinase n=1 Tax=Paractinoplanes ferrugineus TaxID=113564 RepID=A0A919J4C4_9ACTN|nr:glycerate kinase [Actinoplanes ferrugineus]GIE13132.1 glycerate kinase [Actinoplanes ferrugineus]
MVTLLLAPDSFKGTMSAETVATALADGVTAAGGTPLPCPLADGGEGTDSVLHAALGGTLTETTVSGPLGQPVRGRFLLTPDGRTAVVATAAASGLGLVPPDRRDAEAATSTGTGELLVAAARAGAERILLGVGGSACTDGGAGALQAIAAGGGLGTAELIVLCDVRTAFEDAAIVYAPQKGAGPAAVERLTARLHHVAGSLPRDPRGVARTGAAGGLSGALWAVHHASLVSGIDAVLAEVDFEALLRRADLVVTGEGCLDAQTAQGKVVSGVARRCAAAGVPVVAVVGRSRLDPRGRADLGLTTVIEAGDPASLRAAAIQIVAGRR